MQNYFYHDKAGQEIGPLTLDTLAKLRFAGVLDDDTPVRSADSENWMPCREVVAAPATPAPPQPVNAGTGKTSLPPALMVLIIIGALIYGGMTLYKSVAAKTTLTYGFFVDGKELSALQLPEVKVDGQPFASGDHLKPGKHEISIRLENVEPYKQHVWVFYGDKNVGTLPLEYSKGSLSVTVNPSPATVILQHEGEVVRQGDAPLNADKLRVGDYTLIIRRGEYEEIRSAKIQREQQTKVQADLNLGSVDLSSDPAAAEFDLSGKGRHWQGKLPTKIEEVPGGNYSLVVSRKGWELNKDISVARGGITTKKVEFPYGSIEMTSDPTGMTVLTNCVKIGKTPMTLQELIPGQYTLTVSDGENDFMADVSVRVGPKEAAKHAFVFHYGTVQLSSTPAGATVIRKEKVVGKTPLTLNIPIGKLSIELRLDGYVSTNLLVGASEGATANLSVKLISEQYLQAMKKAHDAFDAGQFANSRIAIAAALAVEPDDPDAVKLQAEVAEAEQKAAMEKRFKQLTASIPDSGMFAIYSREYSSGFDKVWNAVINVLKQQTDKIANSNPQNGLIITDLTRHEVLLPFHYDRYLILVERSGGNTTKVNLKLMRFLRGFVGDHNSQEILQPSRQEGVVERQANGFFDKIGQELNAP